MGLADKTLSRQKNTSPATKSHSVISSLGRTETCYIPAGFIPRELALFLIPKHVNKCTNARLSGDDFRVKEMCPRRYSDSAYAST